VVRAKLPEPGDLSRAALGDRYHIVSSWGRVALDRTYLAEDNRFKEFCVLKEFAPQVQSAHVPQKAEEMFEREAGVLYKFQHPQISSPRPFQSIR